MSMSQKKPQPVPPAATRWAEQTHLGVAQGGQRAFPRGRRQLKSKGFGVRLIRVWIPAPSRSRVNSEQIGRLH